MSNNFSTRSEVKFKPAQTKARLQNAAKLGLTFMTISLQKRVVANLSKGGTGTRYSGNPARSSTYGGMPAVQTGRLRNSFGAGEANITHRKTKSGAKLVFGQHKGGKSTKYGWILETSARLDRAFLLPALKRFTPRAPRVFKAVFDKAVNHINRTGGFG
jgi:hypothetical protein